MLAYLIKRFLASVGVLLGMILLVMLIMDIIPGDPAALMLGESATPEMVANLRHQLGLDQPVYVRYFQYVGKLLQGDLGRSVREMSDVSRLLAATWPNTLLLAAVAMSL
jgi:peptide/nickel transport system permease protein